MTQALEAAPRHAPPGATGVTIITRVVDSPVGELLLGATDRGLCVLQFVGREAEPHRPGYPCEQVARVCRRLGAAGVAPGEHPVLDAARAQLREYFAGRRRVFDLPLDLAGTPFQVECWRALTRIPFGETRSYAQVAREIGRPAAVRAVGQANHANAIAIVVPCHRVIGADGSAVGFGGGIGRKRALLALESGEGPLFAG